MGDLEVACIIFSIVCLVITLLIISTETAYINLTRPLIEYLIRTKVSYAKIVAAIKNDMEGLLSIKSLIAAIADAVVTALCNPVCIAVIAFLMFIFDRVMPKLITVGHLERLAPVYTRYKAN